MEPTLPIRVRDARDEVSIQTNEGVLLDPEQIFRSLYNVVGIRTVDAQRLVMGQVELARRRSARRWLENAAYFGTILFESKWVEENIGKRKRKPSKTLYAQMNKTPAQSQPSPVEVNSDESPKRSWKNQRPHRPQSRSPEPSRPIARSRSRQDTRPSLAGTHRQTHRTKERQEARARTPPAPGQRREEARVRTPPPHRQSREEARVRFSPPHRQSREEAGARTLPAVRDKTGEPRSQGEARVRTHLEQRTASSMDRRKRRRSPASTISRFPLESREDTSKRIKAHSDEDEARDETLTITTAFRDVSGAPTLGPELSQGKRRSRKRGQRKVYSCPMAGCDETTLRLKWHVLHDHAPGIFNEDITPSDKVSNRRYAALSFLAKALNGPTARVEDLVALLNNVELIGELWEIQENQDTAMRVMCRVMNWPLPEAFSLTPVNSPACLIHWRALTALLQNLSAGVIEDLQRTFSEPQSEEASAPVGEQEVHRELSPEPAPRRQAFDSHFHLDRLQQSLELPLDTSFRRTMAAVGNIPEEHQVSLAGCTAVFCDLSTYPTPERIDELVMDSISVAIGVHPKSKILSEEEEFRFISTFSHQNVVALGEIGLDYTTHFMEWPRQERQFVKLLQHANVKDVVVILHLRGLASEPLGREVNLRALALASETLKKRQIIHLHCFSGSPDVVQAWLKSFPNTFFGFTGMVRNFNFTQCQALKKVPRDRLLLETDAPYFYPKGFSVNAPCLLGYTAETVAEIREESVEEVLSSTTANAVRIYVGTVGDQ